MISKPKLVILLILSAILIWFLLPQDAVSYDYTESFLSEGDAYLTQSTIPPLYTPYRLSQSLLEANLYEVAIANSIDPVVFITTMECESNLYTGAVGDSGTSFGVYQIHLPAHPSVTIECATDLYCATDYAIPLWKSRPEAWTCYRNIYLN